MDDTTTARARTRGTGTCHSPAALAAIALATLVALAAGAASLAVPAGASTPDAAAVNARTVPRGRVVVGVGPSLAYEESFLPLAGRGLELRLYGRGRIGRPARLDVRVQPPARGCARSRGSRLPIRATGGGGGSLNPIAVTDTFRVPRPAARRICVFAGARLVGDQSIRFFDREFGAVFDSAERRFSFSSPDRGTAPVAVWGSNAKATFPFTITHSSEGCHTTEPEERREGLSDRTGLASTGSATSQTFDTGRCDRQMDTTAYRAASGPLWTVSYGSDQALSPDRPIAHNGACVPDMTGLAVYDARRHIEAQGCRVGRVIALAERSRGGYAVAPGTAYAAVRNGEEVLLAPRGTTLDIVVNGKPSSSLTGANPTVTTLLRRYGDQRAAGETHLTSNAGPRVPGREGLVLVRYFIPSATAAGGLLKGDGRSFSSDPAVPYRAALLWDPTSGRVDFRVAGSCRKGVLGFLFDVHKACKPALALKSVARDAVYEDADSRRMTNLVDVGGAGASALDVRFSILNSYTNSLPGPLGAWSVDQTLTISQAPTPTGFALRTIGNGYPAMEAYWFADQAGAVPQAIARRDVEHPHVAAYKVPADRGGGDAALDRASWATCETTADGSSTVCRDRHNGGRSWTTPNG